ncbi:MAG: hypothetical protein AAB554_02175, partial [Patescibacteria group bacterium]
TKRDSSKRRVPFSWKIGAILAVPHPRAVMAGFEPWRVFLFGTIDRMIPMAYGQPWTCISIVEL